MVPGNQTPEQQARDRIDARLAQAGWIISPKTRTTKLPPSFSNVSAPNEARNNPR